MFLLSDSQIVLHRLRGSSKIWQPFVANTVTQVQALTLPEYWGYCSGSDNSVYLTTRGESAGKILFDLCGSQNLLIVSSSSFVDLSRLATFIPGYLRHSLGGQRAPDFAS
ncbi:hypothetical protein NPIL_594761 [Nephila pilipes]|uniref:Uncharacterized protein n=1 Tax=Nephila pilipes TaxID=299642 RepID=A0A8X6TU67_NEPPI|nr:hypothetical protein NPIL_594761 [Nephila pilipes]